MLTRPLPATTCSTSARPKRAVRVAEQRDFALGSGRKVGMAALGRRRDQPAVHVVQQGDTQAGSCGDQRDVAAGGSVRRAAACAARQSSSTGTAYAIAMRSLRTRTRFSANAVATVRPSTRHGTWVEPRGIVDDRAGDAEARPIDRRAIDRPGLEKRGDHRREIGEVERREDLDGKLARTGTCRIEQSEPRAGAADVAGEDHEIG